MPAVTIDDITVNEGSMAVFTVPLSKTSDQSALRTRDVTVDYATQPGTAGSADFTPTSGHLTFAPGVRQLTIAVPTVAAPAPECPAPPPPPDARPDREGRSPDRAAP